MKITPLEIRQRVFEKAFRGYDKDEVRAFLTSLSQEWERVAEESKTYRSKHEKAERELEKMREVESSLFKTLKTAEDTGANVIEQANKTAELQLQETKLNAEKILNDAKTQAIKMLDEAKRKHDSLISSAHKRCAETVSGMNKELKDLEFSYRTIVNLKERLLGDLKILTTGVNDKLERFSSKNDIYNLESQLEKARKLGDEFGEAPEEQPVEEVKEIMETQLNNHKEKKAEKVTVEVPKEEPKPAAKKQKSFFDEIE